MSYGISSVDCQDRRSMAEIERLLQEEGLRPDKHADYICAMFDENNHAIATGCCVGNTLRCFAVSSSHRGEGLLNQILYHLTEVQISRGNSHLFLYTKPETAPMFGDLGFHEIARVENRVVFMENRRSGFPGYLSNLASTRRDGVSAAIVMNANPFTLGHQYLVEQASAACDTLHIFVVSEDISQFPFSVRRRLVADGTRHLSNVVLHDCGPYIISAATFPSYFLPDDTDAAELQARLDVAVFARIAQTLNITQRWAGEEPKSPITCLYNRVMSEELPKSGIRFIEIPRKKAGDAIISASTVRALIRSNDFSALEHYLPPTTLEYLMNNQKTLPSA